MIRALLLACAVAVAGCAAGPRATRLQIASTTCFHGQAYNDRCEPLDVGADLHLPPQPTDRLVIISHGSQGWDARHPAYARALNEAGIAALVFDHWTPRGIGRAQLDYATNAAQRGARAFNMAMDALRAVELLSAEPHGFRHFGYLGESMGGNAVLLVTQRELGRVHRREFGSAPPAFAALVALYPGCFERGASDRFAAVPVLVMSGERDNSNPSRLCRRYVGWMNARGGTAAFVEVPGQTHHFDAPYGLMTAWHAQNPARCASFVEAGQRIWEETGQPFPNTAAGYRAFERACLAAGASEAVTAGHTGDPRMGYETWLAFFGERLGR